jgi:hypothetical protein
MTRILYWNINNISRAKIAQFAGPTSAAMSLDRREHIMRVMAPKPPDAPRPVDLIIVIEVAARNNEIKTSGLIVGADSNAGQALFLLLGELRDKTNEEWCMVPAPIDGAAGKREAVGIFYKASTLTFTGPWIYSWAELGAKLRVPVDAYSRRNIADYPASYQRAFPVAQRSWDSGGGNMIPENRGAAQTQFVKKGKIINFPTAEDRAPTYVRMRDQNGRTLKIFTVHTSPALADSATRCLAQIPELETLTADEVAVVVGDFNCDSFAAVEAVDDPYYRLRDPNGLQFDMLLKARETATGPVVLNRQPYCMTHLLPNARPKGNTGFTRVARPFDGSIGGLSPQNNVYPRLGYMGSSWPAVNSVGAIDNAFVKYGAGLNPVPHNTTIVNTIVGQPYTAVNPPAGVTPDLTNGLLQASDVTMSNPAMQPTGFPANAEVSKFNNWRAYQHIYDTSDHLALIFDV